VTEASRTVVTALLAGRTVARTNVATVVTAVRKAAVTSKTAVTAGKVGMGAP